MRFIPNENDILLSQVELVAGARNHSSLRSEKIELKQLLKDIRWCMSMPDFWYLSHA
ncbi:MAG: hypothetical protein L3J15_02060 [Devosiaceae bacterium]|nr:hypothetical protein [Devosiaceae bacterium]